MVTQMARTVPYTRIFKIAMDNEERQSESADKTVHKIVHDADYVSEIRQNSPNGVDLVLDWHYDDNFQRDFNLLRPMGKYVLFGDKTSFFQKIFEMAKSVSLKQFLVENRDFLKLNTLLVCRSGWAKTSFLH